MVDQTGEKCVKCQNGKYEVKACLDDYNGKLICNKCGYQVDRYISKTAINLFTYKNQELFERLVQ